VASRICVGHAIEAVKMRDLPAMTFNHIFIETDEAMCAQQF
jgi:hypothetical protein